MPIGHVLDDLDPDHAQSLQWFLDHEGQDVNWGDLGAGVPLKLGFSQQGIFKPKSLSFAISVKHMANGPYDDGDLELNADGSWTWAYKAEKLTNSGKEPVSTHAMFNAMNEGVPVGVMVQHRLKGPYRIHGLGTIVDYDESTRTFHLESLDGTERHVPDRTDDLLIRAAANIADAAPLAAFKLVIAAVKRRQGQSKFRAELIRAFDGRCAMSRSDALPAFEAAHIFPVGEGGAYLVSNGLLLRADLHTLFDLAHVAVHPDSRLIELSPTLRVTDYASLDGKRIVVPDLEHERPDPEALRKRYQLFQTATVS